MPIELSVNRIVANQLNGECHVILKHARENEYLPILIGPAEAHAIAIVLKGIVPTRPLTHDLMQNILALSGIKVTHVLISRIVAGMFYAVLVTDTCGRHGEIDSRTSDAIALALRLKVPIFVSEEVWVNAGVITCDGERISPRTEHIPKEQLGAFREVIESLNLDGL